MMIITSGDSLSDDIHVSTGLLACKLLNEGWQMSPEEFEEVSQEH